MLMRERGMGMGMILTREIRLTMNVFEMFLEV